MRRRRRTAALCALGALALAVVVLARSVLHTDSRGARVLHFTIAGPDVPGPLAVAAVIPAGGGVRPLLVLLHGKGGDQDSELNDAMFAALAALGRSAPDVVFPYGGQDSYWHDRRDGRWGAYVLREVIPAALTRLHADARRVAIGGISMGGFGALDLARLAPGRFCAVGGHSAAVWVSGADSAAGAFDDAQDFARHDVIAAARAGNPYGRTPVWLDVGSEDPFRAADTALARALSAHGAAVQLHVWPGGHGEGYWRRHWGSYLGFYARALARCR